MQIGKRKGSLQPIENSHIQPEAALPNILKVNNLIRKEFTLLASNERIWTDQDNKFIRSIKQILEGLEVQPIMLPMPASLTERNIKGTSKLLERLQTTETISNRENFE